MTYADLIARARDQFSEGRIDDAAQEAEFLLAGLLGMPKPQLVLHRRDRVSDELSTRFNDGIRQRRAGQPLAYILGEQPFGDLSIMVTKDVLVPRPETELLAECVVRILDDMTAPYVAIDVGTGSGAIALSIAKHSSVQRVIGIDRSPEAIQVARSNGERLGLTRCEWLEGNLLDPLSAMTEKADVIVANLPYIRTGDIASLAPEVRSEPLTALDGGPDGLGWIRELIPQAATRLRRGGCLLLEIGFDQSEDVCRLLEDRGLWEEPVVDRDLAGWPRIVRTVRKG